MSEVSKVHALSSNQERKLLDFLDEQFLIIAGAYRKRSQPSTSKLPTLSSYLEANRQLLSVILQIPPIDPSTSLRIMFLLRLTGEVLNCIPGYSFDTGTLVNLLDFLDDLDQAWLTVLENQIWDPNSKASVDLIVPADNLVGQSIHSTPMSQTERTRLRSLLISGTEKLEEWLAGIDLGEEDMLDQAGLQQSFDDLFSNTLGELGGLAGVITTGLEATC